jgi:hypothetical protein
LDENNEKATGAFCRLSKEGGTNDDVTQIKDNNGQEFKNGKDRGIHISGFYSELFKRKQDNLLSIEDFLGRNEINAEWVTNKKLNEEEKGTLEGEITLAELDEALKSSNYNSASGWDGLSFKVISKFWGDLRELTKRMANESFTAGELTETFKMGLIKIIPKKGDCGKIGDWRPITLLSCGYKLVSGVVAKKLEKYLMNLSVVRKKGF